MLKINWFSLCKKHRQMDFFHFSIHSLNNYIVCSRSVLVSYFSFAASPSSSFSCLAGFWMHVIRILSVENECGWNKKEKRIKLKGKRKVASLSAVLHQFLSLTLCMACIRHSFYVWKIKILIRFFSFTFFCACLLLKMNFFPVIWELMMLWGRGHFGKIRGCQNSLWSLILGV